MIPPPACSPLRGEISLEIQKHTSVAAFAKQVVGMIPHHLMSLQDDSLPRLPEDGFIGFVTGNNGYSKGGGG